MSIKNLSLLEGKWSGNGSANFPTIQHTDYLEELEFKFIGDDESMHFDQRTWILKNGEKTTPLHWESGFIISYPDGTYEMFNAQNSKRVEVMKSINFITEDNRLLLTLESKHFANDDRMVRTVRSFYVEGNKLVYDMGMATQNTPDFQHHLHCELQKSSITFMI